MADQAAFYARRGGPAADWWTLLHPPYTLWHLSYVALGAAVVPAVDWGALLLALGAFLLAVGVAAHALDELQGRPLRTGIPDAVLWAATLVTLAGAVALGLVGVFWWDGTNWPLAVTIPVGAFLVFAYNLELFGGRFHTDTAFALSWGGFPVVVGYLMQSPDHTVARVAAVVALAAAGVGTSAAQRALSTPARRLRRHTTAVAGTVTADDGTVTPLEKPAVLAPLEQALRAMSWAMPLLAAAALLARA